MPSVYEVCTLEIGAIKFDADMIPYACYGCSCKVLHVVGLNNFFTYLVPYNSNGRKGRSNTL